MRWCTGRGLGELHRHVSSRQSISVGRWPRQVRCALVGRREVEDRACREALTEEVRHHSPKHSVTSPNPMTRIITRHPARAPSTVLAAPKALAAADATTLRSITKAAIACATILLSCTKAPPASSPRVSSLSAGIGRLPTGALLDPAGVSVPVGAMALGAIAAPGGRHVILGLSGWRQQGLQVVARQSGRVVQMVTQPSVFLGLAASPDGRWVYASGGNADVIYRYRWSSDSLAREDSLVLAIRTGARGTRYPSGIALSPDGRTLYVAENLGDALAVVDLSTGRVRARYPTPRYPYGVAVAPDGDVFVSAWTGNAISVYRPSPDGLREVRTIPAGRHPSAMLLTRDGSRLFVASASTDQVTVIDTRAGQVLTSLHDAPPAASEGSTPNALALSPDEKRLYVAEADNNGVAVFALSAASRGAVARDPLARQGAETPAAAASADTLLGRIPVGWYPTALVMVGDTLLVANGKGRGTGPNRSGPTPSSARAPDSHTYTLGQLEGSLTSIATAEAASVPQLATLSRRVARANGWDAGSRINASYPPFEHVIYVIKENRTYDQVFGDLAQADGDTSLLFFPRPVSPNHHALAERFGIFDRFFVNAEVSPDGHNWSTAAYVTDYAEKTVPSNYSSRGRTYDYEGTNRGSSAASIPDDDVAEPANGYLWDALVRAGRSFRNYGEYVVASDSPARAAPGAGRTAGVTPLSRYIGTKPALRDVTVPDYPGFDLDVTDQVRADVWLRDFAADVQRGSMPALEIVRLPNDHTAGARAGSPTPVAYMADNDLALGRMVDAVSRSPFWKSTVFFVLEDDAQNGPDHVDSHRSVLLVISPYGRGGAIHRWVNTTDVIATMLEILHAPHLSQFDTHARPLREIWASTADLKPFTRLVPDADLSAKNPLRSQGARDSKRLNLSMEDAADEGLFNRVLWRSIKGRAPYPTLRRASIGDLQRDR
jgi:DNA-binding beta-propeller fold protein YncE